ncbi:MAG: hypothetical protein ABI592_13770 [Acidobacteriota bacterium]
MIQSSLAIAAASSPEAVSTPPHILLSALAFLGLGVLLVVAAVVAAGLAGFGKRRAARSVAAAAAGAVLFYAVVLFAAAWASRDRTLGPGGRKYFCELDCHLAYSLEPAAASGTGGRAVVVVRTWFDPATTSAWRGDTALTPNPRVAWIVDAAGRRYLPLPPTAGAGPDSGVAAFDRPLRPGESSQTTLSFDLPGGVRGPRLYVGDRGMPGPLLIGHENSPGHGKIYFALGSPAPGRHG